MQRERLPYLLIPLAAFVAIAPLLIHGCSCGHDFDFHIPSWFEAARQFTHGNLHPHWAYTPAWNAGEPRFVFYPPLSWTIGGLLGLLLPWTWTPILYTWLVLTASGLALRRLARDYTTPSAALIAATVYTVNPYMLFTAYERTAYAELLAAAWIPMLLHAILRKQVTIPRIAIPIALLWLTNAPAAVMSCYVLALLTLIRLATNSSSQFLRVASNDTSATSPGAPYLDSEMWVSRANAIARADAETTTSASQTPIQIAINSAAGTVLGLGLAAFYIIPAAYERRYIQIAMAIIPNMRIEDNFLFHHTGDVPHDQVLHTASIIAVLLIAATGIVILLSTLPIQRSSAARPERTVQPLLTSLTILTIVIALLLTPITAFIWTHAPELAFLQFPWRLIAILASVLALAIALALPKLNLKPIPITALAFVIAAILTYPAYAIFHQVCDPEDTIQSRLNLFDSNHGTEPTDEYTPTTADNDSLAQTNPGWWLSTDPNAKAPVNEPPAPVPTHFAFKATQPGYLVLNLRDYPSWLVSSTASNSMALNHPNHIQRDDGLIVLPIDHPANFTIDIAYTQTLDQTLGDAISLLSFVSLVLLIRRDYRRLHAP
jgi:hypothetical protein